MPQIDINSPKVILIIIIAVIVFFYYIYILLFSSKSLSSIIQSEIDLELSQVGLKK